MIRAFLDLSTGHLTPHTRQRFEDDETPSYTLTGTFGWFIHVPDKDSLAPEDAEEMPDLAAAFELARKNHCDYIMFDGDAPMIENLPVYEDDEQAA